MKKLTLITTMALAAFTFQACNNTGNKDTVETADSVNAEMDTTTSAVEETGAGVAEFDAKFAVDAANGGMAEVALGNLAQQKASNAEVKKFAEMMVKDHTKANEELKALATAKNITLPAAPGDEQQKKAAELGEKAGAEFDKAYAEAMVKDHDKTVSMFEDAANNAVDADIKAFATKTLPVLKAHQQHAKALNDKLK
ncbi:DUF4142 domain-containing protein [Mucilaginibacter hurinus]|uniref:DUF4142 domain-containing protein n=1 Tax=Mucilaginibacter hurinus TaxID=2201324 RepID=A0A367GNG7_9SPHI|nr:DUF4142 domain-containing protein [Mucilaginibacter hurinus]RCH54233.1 DUF4142 domain-containing protein [Mucilaginibacter hurinus]